MARSCLGWERTGPASRGRAEPPLAPSQRERAVRTGDFSMIIPASDGGDSGPPAALDEAETLNRLHLTTRDALPQDASAERPLREIRGPVRPTRSGQREQKAGSDLPARCAADDPSQAEALPLQGALRWSRTGSRQRDGTAHSPPPNRRVHVL